MTATIYIIAAMASLCLLVAAIHAFLSNEE